MAESNTRASDIIKKNMEAYCHNPSLICTTMIELLEQATDIDVVDASSPFMSLVEGVSVLGSTVLSRMEVLTRRIYPLSNQEWEELYPHMSDNDFVDIFALPDSADFVFIFSKEELVEKMVSVPNSNIRKITIPRNTKVKALDTVFSLEYPIEIRQMNHGGIQVVWDGKKTTPLLNLTTNRIDWWVQVDTSTQTEFLLFKIPMKQFDIITATETVTDAQQLTINLDFPDQFYYCRVWRELSDGTWMELPITFSEITYSLSRPTAIVTVLGNRCSVTIPQYYVNELMIQTSTRIRADVYYTKANIDLSLANYSRNNYVIEWYAIDSNDRDAYQAPLKTLNTVDVSSLMTTLGGRKALTFAQVKERVISNAVGSPRLPITPAQIEYALDSKGYELVRNINTATKRIYLATRRMPQPYNEELITAANAGVHTLNVSMDELVGINTVIDNDSYITITPDTIYRMVNSAMVPITNAERQYIQAMSRDQLAQEITKGYYYYSPFHYVIDTTEDALRCRSYYLKKPTIPARSFIAENDTTLLQVGIKSAKIEVIKNGFRLTVSTFASQDYKDIPNSQVFAQLAFAPDNTGDMAYLNGVYKGLDSEEDRIFTFDIDTRYLVDSHNKIELTTFKMYDQNPQWHKTPLETQYSVIFSTTAVMPTGYEPNEVDAVVGRHLLPPGVSGIMHEQLTIKFGDALTNMWNSSRSVVAGNEYDTWAVDIPKVYEHDEYEEDPITKSTIKVVNGQIVQTKIASKGDPVLNDKGEPVYLYRKGMVKYDSDGKPLIIKTRRTRRLVDVFLVEAAYYFGDSIPTVEYREMMAQTLVDWITRDIAEIQTRSLDNTEILFYPSQTTGKVEVLYGPSLNTELESAQSFNVNAYVNNSIYKNEKIREQLIRKTVQSIQETLKNKTVSTSLLTENLRDVYGDDVISFEISKIDKEKQLTVVTLLDDSRNMSLKKRLTLRSDDVLAVEEDVTVQFYRHVTDF